MTKICFYFQVHQPYRIGKYRIFDIGHHSNYFDHKKNQEVLDKVSKKCYLPTNKLLLNLIHKYRGKFKIAYSLTGMAIEQFEEYAPKVLESFQALNDTGCVEFLNETYNHSLAYLYSKKEFSTQVELHRQKIWQLFKQKPKIFRNTELIFNNELARYVEQLGYQGILAEGADHILGWRSPNYVYKAKTTKNLKLLLKNYKLSDDVAFRFSNRSWEQYPLYADKFASWIAATQGQTVNLFMDYETFGEHQWEDTGIFSFLEHLPQEILKYPHLEFGMPTELLGYQAMDELDIHSFISWADIERDLSAWLGNRMQQSAIHKLYALENDVIMTNDVQLLKDWRKMQTSDHFYYMCTKWFNDGDVHKYFNPYDTPYDAFMNFMNALQDIQLRIQKHKESIIMGGETPMIQVH